MLNYPTIEKLVMLRLTGMAEALKEQMSMPDIGSLGFDERMGLLVDREMTGRENKRLSVRLKEAKLREQACLEDIDYRHPRGLDKAVILKLASCQWIRDRHCLLICGSTGCGKTYVACALGHKAIMSGYTVLYVRMSEMLGNLAIGRGDGRYARIMKSFARADLLILDDFGLAPLTADSRRDLFEIVEERHGRKSTVVTSQIPVEKWHTAIGDPTIADAILDRLIHDAYKITMKGESMRKVRSKLTKPGS